MESAVECVRPAEGGVIVEVVEGPAECGAILEVVVEGEGPAEGGALVETGPEVVEDEGAVPFDPRVLRAAAPPAATRVAAAAAPAPARPAGAAKVAMLPAATPAIAESTKRSPIFFILVDTCLKTYFLMLR